MAVTNEQRKAVYNFYRSIGYTVKEARASRNRPVKVFDDYQDYKALKPEDYKVRMPAVPASKTQLKKVKIRLRELGINKATSDRITRKKSTAFQTLYKIERYFEVVQKKMRGKGAKKRWKETKADLIKAMKKADFWDFMGDAYDYIIGVKAG